MKLSEEEVEQIIAKNPLQMFDVCSKCEGVELHGVMSEVNEIDFDLICDKCLEEDK
jgi:hypothetical protein